MNPNEYVTCTCWSTSETDHLDDCDLWLDSSFANDETVWSEEYYTLRPLNIPYMEWQRQQEETLGAPVRWTENDIIVPSGVATTKNDKYGSWMCSHWQKMLVLPSGTVVHGSGSANRPKNHTTPEAGGVSRIVPTLGVYLSSTWVPDCIAYHIGCYDMDVPEPAVANVLFMVEQALSVAKQGAHIEVGCMGGHGRTGMVLAIMVGMDDPNLTPDDCMEYIWGHYCKYAIETHEQENYISFALLHHRSCNAAVNERETV